MSASTTKKINGAQAAPGSGPAKGNGCATVGGTLPSKPVSVLVHRTPLDRYKRPYSCEICGLRLPEADAANLDRVIATHGKVVRVMCSSHTGMMDAIEYRLLRHPHTTVVEIG